MTTPNQAQLQHQLGPRTPRSTQNQIELLKLQEKYMTHALESQAQLERQLGFEMHNINMNKIRRECGQSYMDKVADQEAQGWPSRNRTPERLGGEGQKFYAADFKMAAYKKRDVAKLQEEIGRRLKVMMFNAMTGPTKMERWPPVQRMKTQRRQEAHIQE